MIRLYYSAARAATTVAVLQVIRCLACATYRVQPQVRIRNLAQRLQCTVESFGMQGICHDVRVTCLSPMSTLC